MEVARRCSAASGGGLAGGLASALDLRALTKGFTAGVWSIVGLKSVGGLLVAGSIFFGKDPRANCDSNLAAAAAATATAFATAFTTDSVVKSEELGYVTPHDPQYLTWHP